MIEISTIGDNFTGLAYNTKEEFYEEYFMSSSFWSIGSKHYKR